MKLPRLVEIEINSHCNLTCSYCPNSVAQRIEQGDMDPEVFKKIIQQLKKYNYSGQMAFEFYNEPLLCTHIDEFIKEAKTHLPEMTLILYSNGMKINSKERFEELVSLGVDKFIITKHEEVKKLALDDFYSELSESQKAIISLKGHDEIIKYNRAGILPKLGSGEQTRQKPCSLPEHILTITVKGNILSCFEDFNQTYGFGNINEKNAIEIWNSPEYEKFRNDLKNGKRDLYKTCSSCNRVDRDMSNKNKHLIDEQELEAIKAVLESGKFFRYQQEPGECELFDQEFSKFLGTKATVSLSSGTNALIAALMALEIGEGDEVLIPSYTFFATASAVLNVGAIPVVVNIGKDLLISLEEVKRAVTEDTKAIIPVHMDGLQCEIEKISAFAKEEGLYLIEDVAQALGASYKGRKLGSFGDLGCFSFNKDKTISCGEGGAVTTSDEVLAEKLLCITDQAYAFNPLHKDKFKHITPLLGTSMRISEISGAMLRVQLKKVDRILEENAKRKKLIDETLKNSPFYGKFFNLVESNDYEGQTFSTFHLQLNSPDQAVVLSKKFLSRGIMMIPLSMRVAHSVWKWNEYLKEGMTFDKRRDPYLKTTKKYEFQKINYIDSLDTLMGTLRGEIDITLSLEEVEEMANLMVNIIGELNETA